MRRLVVSFWVLSSIACQAFTCLVVPAGGNWNAAATWSGCNGTFPQADDDVVFDATSGDVVLNVTTNIVRSIDMRGYTHTFSGVVGNRLWVGPSAGTATNHLGGIITITNDLIACPSAGATTILYSHGVAYPGAVDIGFGATVCPGTLIIADSLNAGGTTHHFGFFSGTVHLDGATDDLNLTHTIGSLSSGGPLQGGTIYLGHSTVILTGRDGAACVLCFNTASTVLHAGFSTIRITDVSANAKAFQGGGHTYNDVVFAGDNVTISEDNNFRVFSINTAGMANGLKLTAGNTQTASDFRTNGSSGSLAKVLSTAAAPATLSKSGAGLVCMDYLNPTWITGTPGATWNVGSHSVDGGNNVGLSFTDCRLYLWFLRI